LFSQIQSPTFVDPIHARPFDTRHVAGKPHLHGTGLFLKP
jgi:hypothetical protein